MPRYRELTEQGEMVDKWLTVFDKEGRELPDPDPVEVPIHMRTPFEETMEQMMMRLLRQASMEAARNGDETFEEANDFEIDDEELYTDGELEAMLNEHTARGVAGRGPVEPEEDSRSESVPEQPSEVEGGDAGDERVGADVSHDVRSGPASRSSRDDEDEGRARAPGRSVPAQPRTPSTGVRGGSVQSVKRKK